MGAYRYASAVSAEIVGGTLPEKRFPPRILCRNMLSPSRPEGRTGGGGAYSLTSLVSAVMLARIGPVKPFRSKPLITHSEGCGRTERSTHALAQRGRRRIDRNLGTHICVSAVSAEIVDGTLPEKRLLPRALCRNVLIRTPESAGRPHGRRRGAQVSKPGERRDAREDRAGEAVQAQVPDRAK